jgi:hypothetical protein
LDNVAVESKLDILWDRQNQENNGGYREDISQWHVDAFRLIKGTYEVMELDEHQNSNTNYNAYIELCIVRDVCEPALHTKERGEAPEYGGNQKREKKPVPLLPWPVG